MPVTIRTTLVAAALALTGGAALAQAGLTGTQRVDDRVRAMEDRVADDLARGEDRLRFGNEEFAPGWTGSLALGGSAAYGNSDTRDLSLAGRFRYVEGPWVHTFAFGVEQARAGGIRTRDQVFGVYDANYYVARDSYLFGLARFENDRFASIQDSFLGVGVGYRVVNTPETAWRVQLGPGLRSNRAGGVRVEEAAALVASRFYHRISDGVFLSNDTDMLYSRNAGTRVTNDFGVTVRVSQGVSTRLSYATDWTNRPAPGRQRTDSRVGVSLVFALN